MAVVSFLVGVGMFIGTIFAFQTGAPVYVGLLFLAVSLIALVVSGACAVADAKTEEAFRKAKAKAKAKAEARAKMEAEIKAKEALSEAIAKTAAKEEK